MSLQVEPFPSFPIIFISEMKVGSQSYLLARHRINICKEKLMASWMEDNFSFSVSRPDHKKLIYSGREREGRIILETQPADVGKVVITSRQESLKRKEGNDSCHSKIDV